MVDGVTLRWLVKDDLKKLIALEAECFDNPWRERAMRRHLKTKGTSCLVAECGPEILGYAIYNVDSSFCSIDRIATAPTVRRVKIATSLMEKAINVAHERNCQIVEAFIHEADLDAQLFFKKMGFVFIAAARDDGDDWFIMQRKLHGYIKDFQGKPRIA